MTAADPFSPNLCPDSETVFSGHREDWLAKRRAGIGGSDISAILGMNKYSSPRDVWLSKTGQGKDAHSWPIVRGNALERPLLDWFAQQTGRPVQSLPMQRNVERPWMLGSTDGISGDGILEAKTASYWVGRHDWADGIADHAEIQIQWYMAVTGLRHGWVIAALGDDDPVIKPVQRDQQLIDTLIDAAETFWVHNVLGEVEPELIWLDRGTVADEYPTVERHRVDGTAEVDVQITTRQWAADEIKRLTKIKDAAEAEIIQALGDGDHLVIDGQVAATRKAQSTTRFDRSAAEADGLDLTLYMNTTESRMLRIPAKRTPWKD